MIFLDGYCCSSSCIFRVPYIFPPETVRKKNNSNRKKILMVSGVHHKHQPLHDKINLKIARFRNPWWFRVSLCHHWGAARRCPPPVGGGEVLGVATLRRFDSKAMEIFGCSYETWAKARDSGLPATRRLLRSYQEDELQRLRAWRWLIVIPSTQWLRGFWCQSFRDCGDHFLAWNKPGR